MEELTPIIANLGFPIVVALFLLVRLETKIKCLCAKIDELEKTVGKII
jgi:hypothetical protein